ncbi:PD-(D/E)XK nuclease family protein [Pontibacter sp. BT731]|uniref:PDDEXK-like family protein n=1 Tax=Pontibacter coccineus TaxID=3063328 RepID=UPI0026E47F23|nr:PD-(D/E)XK nuclease family protein [Pontibacter sp. BT731]MDO6392075.1 PD-(D/E)XK nuclease family protein [Pontibacter sp. BT731]
MMVSAEKLGYLLADTKRIIAHQKEVAGLRGETFNVFSILKMERLENSTHSAFITELLNPDGTHLKGNIFLKLFLETLDEVTLTLDLVTAKAKPEHHIGGRDIDAKSGGRIDIYISDDFNNCISIENKIDAGDQEAQIERYCNHNKGKNTVLYLTLHGSEPSIGSKGTLESGADFHNISYRKHILVWLDMCLKEAADSPILRETIKQYKILIQKLTATMAEKQTQQLINLMLSHYKEAEYIAANFNRVTIELREEIRQSVIKKLQEHVGVNYTITAQNAFNNPYTLIWIKLKGMEDKPIFFIVETFSGLPKGHFGGALFVGTVDVSKDESEFMRNNDHHIHRWYNAHKLNDFEQYELKLSNSDLLQKINSNSNFKNNLVDHIVSEIEAYLAKETDKVRFYLNKLS